MSPLDLIRSRDGSMSLTKLAASTAHLLAAILFLRLQWNSPFDPQLWGIYLGVTVLHATYDKTTAMLKNYADAKSDRSAGADHAQ